MFSEQSKYVYVCTLCPPLLGDDAHIVPDSFSLELLSIFQHVNDQYN